MAHSVHLCRKAADKKAKTQRYFHFQLLFAKFVANLVEVDTQQPNGVFIIVYLSFILQADELHNRPELLVPGHADRCERRDV